jgi:hypothetical protein
MKQSSLSAPRQQLLRLMQELQFGTIEILIIVGAEPTFAPPPKIIREIKLGSDVAAWPIVNGGDFSLKREVTDLFAQFDAFSEETAVTIEVRHGLPVRLIVGRGIAR